MEPRTGMVVFVVSCSGMPVKKKGVYVEGRIFFKLGQEWVVAPRECVEYGVLGYRAALFHESSGIIYKAPGQRGFVAVRNGRTFGAGDLEIVEGWLEKQAAAA